MGAFLQPIHTGEIDAVLVQILQHIGHEQDWDNPEINLSQHPLRFCGVKINVFAIFIELVVVVQMCS